jgi:drug/metabolite transporter (DMT)-like permease
MTCVVTGSIMNGGYPIPSAIEEGWFPWAMGMGAFFIVLLNLMAFITQRVGVAVTSVAYKLSLVIPFIFSMYYYREPSTILKWTGVALALVAVVLTCFPSKKDQLPGAKKITPFIWLLPPVLFFGSGVLDTMVKFVEQEFVTPENQNAYLISAFSSAAAIGIIILAVGVIAGKQKLSFKAVIAGICIGVPNYFSIWCLMKALKAFTGNSSGIIPINNMGIVLFSAVFAWLVFKEKLSAINWAGIILALFAIALIAYG